MVLDASVLINLLATGVCRQILEALPSGLLVPEHVVAELRDGGALVPLFAAGVLKKMPVPNDHLETFIALVSNAPDDLGDGEAATIAVALATGAPACLDDTKARRVCTEKFPALQLVYTVELLQRADVASALKGEPYCEAVYRALAAGRMRVPHEHRAWVISVVGDLRLSSCPSFRNGKMGTR